MNAHDWLPTASGGEVCARCQLRRYGIESRPPCVVAGPSCGGDAHTRGEFVLGLGWSCIEDDTFYCPVVNANGEQEAQR